MKHMAGSLLALANGEGEKKTRGKSQSWRAAWESLKGKASV